MQIVKKILKLTIFPTWFNRECEQSQTQSCFPAASQVTGKNFQQKRIDELQPGEEIITIKDGEFKPDVFIGYLHKKEKENSEFISLAFQEDL